MGWNSWDSYGLTITEPEFRANTTVLAHTLASFGWDIAIIDEGWFLVDPSGNPDRAKSRYLIDANGRYIPVPARFPSSLSPSGENTGFTSLAAWVHSLGLQFGIHIVRGIPRDSVARDLPIAGSTFHAHDAADTTDACPWDATNWGVQDSPAGQAWYDALLNQYAGWGIDFLKVDCIADHPHRSAEIRMLHRAIQKTGRSIVLSLSPGPTSTGYAAELAPLAQMWRISDDLWDVWSNPGSFPRSLRDQFELAAAWAPFAKPGNWPDADMLPLGDLGPAPGFGPARHTRLTLLEQQTMLTLWAVARSPLILGANLTRLDPATLTLLTNSDVLAVNQRGHDQHQASVEANAVAWTSELAPGQHVLALFNLGDQSLTTDRPFTFYNLPARAYTARDLWSHTTAAPSLTLRLTLGPHASALLELR